MSTFSLTRRQIMSAGAAALGATLLDPKNAHAAAPNWTWYWDTTPAAHEALRNQWVALGYRPLSISMMGPSSAPRVCALWVQRSGPAFDVGVDIPLADVGPVVELWAFFGWRTTQMSVTGSQADPRFSLVVEETGAVVSQRVLTALRHVNANETPHDGTIEYWKTWAISNQYIPVSIAGYGTAQDPRYALLLHPNPNRIRWNIDGLNESVSSLTHRISANLVQRARPVAVHLTNEQRYATLYRDDKVDGDTVLMPDLTPDRFTSTAQSMVGQGYYPIQLTAAGSDGPGRRYALVYTKSETVLPRIDTRRGLERSSAIDSAMVTIMRNNGIRQGSLAIALDKKLVYARAFTLAENGHRIVTPTMRFRVGSVSKTLTAMLIMKMVQEGLGTAIEDGVQKKLHKRKLNKVLGLTKPNGSPAPSVFDTFTVEQALLHQTTIPRDVDHFKVRQDFVDRGLPIPARLTATDYARFALTQPFVAQAGYSNIAYVMLGLIVEKLHPNKPFLQVLREKILTPLGITRMDVFPIAFQDQPDNEAFPYEPLHLHLVWSVLSGATVPFAYGSMDSLISVAMGGLTAAPADFVKVATAFSKPGVVLDSTRIDEMLNMRYGFDTNADAPGAPRNYKAGGLGGAYAHLVVEKSGFSWCIAFNRDPVDPTLHPSYPTIRTAIASTAPGAWAGADLFQSVELPAG